MLDVKFYEVFSEEEEALRKFISKDLKAEFVPETIQKSDSKNMPAHVISTRTQSEIPIEWAANLKGILSRSQGYDHLQKYLNETKTNTPCGYLTNYCAYSVAEHAIMGMLFLLRKTGKQQEQFKLFNRDGLTGRTARGKKALVVGVGAIGSEIVKLARALHMDVRAVDPVRKFDDLEYVALEKGLEWGDVIFSAVPLLESTTGVINYKALLKNNKSPVIINISRGEITPIEDMLRLLKECKIGGLCLDVYSKEGVLAEDLRDGQITKHKTIEELEKRNDVILTPHNAFNTKESVEEKSKQTIHAIEQLLKIGTFPYML